MNSLLDLKLYIQSQNSLRELRDWVATQDHSDSAHDLAHFYRVAFWTLRLGEGQIEIHEAIAAALLHDIVNVPKDSPERPEASRLCSEKAQEVLPRFGFNSDSIARISEAIRSHSYSRGEKPVSHLARALQDADRLEALGSIGIMRCISTGVKMGADYFHAEDPFALNRPLDDARFSIDHFYTKLLKLSETMTTNAGKREATERTRCMTVFLDSLKKELGNAK